jgi:hypothetical protein
MKTLKHLAIVAVLCYGASSFATDPILQAIQDAKAKTQISGKEAQFINAMTTAANAESYVNDALSKMKYRYPQMNRDQQVDFVNDVRAKLQDFQDAYIVLNVNGKKDMAKLLLDQMGRLDPILFR